MYWKIIFSAVAREAAISRDQGRPKTGKNPCGWPVTSAFDIWYILADILRCPHNEVKNSQRLTYDTFWRIFYAVLTTRSRIRNDWHMIHFGGHFTLSSQRCQEFTTMNFNRTAIIHDPSLLTLQEFWNCKVGFGFSSWMLECCALNFQEQVIIC